MNQLGQYRDVYRDGLLSDILPFWLKHGVDAEYGGMMAAVDRDGSLLDTDKCVWQQGRFTWLLGELYNHRFCADDPNRGHWLAIAERNLEFLETHCFDPADGRLWFHVTREGRPIRKRRYAFSESFAAIAFGEIARATGKDRYAERARQCFRTFVNHSLRPQGVAAKFTSTRPTRSIGFPMICINTAQQLVDSIGLEDPEGIVDECVQDIVGHFLKPEIRAVMETVGASGELLDHFDGRTLNPGHAIEAAWFIMAEGNRRADQELIAVGLNMLDWMWERGWDDEFGGLLYFVGVDGKPVQEYWHDMKFWWPHNEAIIATLLAFQLTGDSRYADWHSRVHEWTYRHFPDPEFGEWFGYLRRDGAVSSPVKGNLWKGPFHIPRMQLVCWEILESLLSNAG